MLSPAGGGRGWIIETMKNNLYNKNLQPFANQLRKTMTKAEACLWKYVLKAGKLQGYSFRRQRPISNYIVDFVSFELRLIIEVDGYSHTLPEIVEKDKLKTKTLNDLGFYVFRVTDGEVLNDISNVIRRLEDFISNPPPPPASGG